MTKKPATVTPQEQHDTIAAALAILTTEEADQIIGTPVPEYGVLLKAVQAQCGLWYAMASRRHGLRRNKASQKTLGQTMVVLYQLFHFAYALGVREGRKGGE